MPWWNPAGVKVSEERIAAVISLLFEGAIVAVARRLKSLCRGSPSSSLNLSEATSPGKWVFEDDEEDRRPAEVDALPCLGGSPSSSFNLSEATSPGKWVFEDDEEDGPSGVGRLVHDSEIDDLCVCLTSTIRRLSSAPRMRNYYCHCCAESPNTLTHYYEQRRSTGRARGRRQVEREGDDRLPRWVTGVQIETPKTRNCSLASPPQMPRSEARLPRETSPMGGALPRSSHLQTDLL